MADSGFSIPADWNRKGLPGWTYFSEELFELERDELFRKHWQYACHVSEVAEPGQYVALNVADERGFVIRGADGVIRAFHNLCRHRGSRIVTEDKGVCQSAIICPFHGWSYNLDGSLRGIARSDAFPELKREEWGLKPLEMEIWQGLVFCRFIPGPQPTLADILRPVSEEVKPYRIDGMQIAEEFPHEEHLPVNWKCVRDVDNEGYHVRQAHPGLHDLYGGDYRDETITEWISRSEGRFNPGRGNLWSVRHYRKHLPNPAHLPERSRNAWIYIGVFPNFVLGLYPDSAIYYQEFPLAPERTLQRGATFKHKNESRELKAARYLSGRIDRIASNEDRLLAVWSVEATKSSAYSGVVFSDLEYGLAAYHDQLRKLLPVLANASEPPRGRLREFNDAMKEENVRGE
ncbi:MAG: aromatic ring-hydroxylating dioxygenase subunit alpha [Albidovulum sp.]|nr:aromatic ring-hydroxylating dioxygenase subunit alpha [Albidovulum sp.]MDE0307717.1 aromatic ring-hydroxylating dioxygenase subunit alpha [Albidovulum sp.]